MRADRIKTLPPEDYPKIYKEFNLNSKQEVFQYCLDKVIEERCDELDYMLEDDGFEILDREMTRVATSIYNYQVIVVRSV